MRTIQANVVGPAVMAQAYLHLLEKSQKKTIVNVTSGLASIGLDLGPKNATYTISKTALNMLVCIRCSEGGTVQLLSRLTFRNLR